MASRRRPKGYLDDLGKLLTKAVKAGDNKTASMLRGRIRREQEAQANKVIADRKLIRDWDSRIAAYDYTVQEASKGKTRAARKRAQSKARGMETKFRGVGQRQQANIGESREMALGRVRESKMRKSQGGKNSRENVAKRQQDRMKRREEIRKELAARKSAPAKKSAPKRGGGKRLK